MKLGAELIDPHENEDLEAALDETVADVVLDETFDAKPESDGLGLGDERLDGELLLKGFDPEAHYRNTAVRRVQIRKQVFSHGGQFVIGLVIGLVSVGAIIMAVTVKTQPYVIAASVIAPPGLIYMAIRWRKWLGHAPYCYRLLTSLGEDAGGLLESHSNKKMAKLQKQMRKPVEK